MSEMEFKPKLFEDTKKEHLKLHALEISFHN